MYYYYYNYFDNLPPTLRLKVKIEFNSPISSSLISGTLDLCEKIAFEIVKDDTKAVINSVMGELTEEQKELVDNEIRKYKDNSLVITNHYSGSIIFEAELAQVVELIILTALGISFNEAWKETQTHRKIKKILTQRIGINASKFINYFNDQLISHKKSLSERVEPTITFDNHDLIDITLKRGNKRRTEPTVDI